MQLKRYIIIFFHLLGIPLRLIMIKLKTNPVSLLLMQIMCGQLEDILTENSSETSYIIMNEIIL